jgi:hypothetical protein
MSELAPTQSITVDLDHRELHFAIGGFWTLEAMQDFLRHLAGAAKPFLSTGTKFSALGDLRGLVTQNRETAEAIRQSLLEGQRNGMTRFAMVTESSLVKLQYRRITDGVAAEFFDNPDAARKWLRDT